jgi:anti-sigma factor RsiW
MQYPVVHLTEGELQACLDGETSAACTLRYVRHLRRCVRCRMMMVVVLDRTNQVARLLSAATSPLQWPGRRPRLPDLEHDRP